LASFVGLCLIGPNRLAFQNGGKKKLRCRRKTPRDNRAWEELDVIANENRKLRTRINSAIRVFGYFCGATSLIITDCR